MFIPRRLDKFLRDMTAFSVVTVRQAIAAGRVTIEIPGEGILPTSMVQASTLIFESDQVRLDGHLLLETKQSHYLVFNKPIGVTSTVHDPDGRRDLSSWIATMPPGVFPVGRLDRMTSGMLLFTNDGDFANAILQPEHATLKLYWLWLDESLTEDDSRLVQMRQGLLLPHHDACLHATDVTILNATSDYTELLVTLDEGKNREIRKMCSWLRLKLIQLHRKAIGQVMLGELPLGSWRFLAPKEVQRLLYEAGGQQSIESRKIKALEHNLAAPTLPAQVRFRLVRWLASI